MSTGFSSSLERGANVIRQWVAKLPSTPGVYRMIGGADEILYIGKARSLKKRIISYTHIDKLPHRLQRMVSRVHRVEVTLTQTELEALLLESSLIKKEMPPFNILLKDDKSFPFLRITDHPFPQILKHRGAQKKGETYFGPFANGLAVNETLEILRSLFQLRTCSDTYFATRKRPCLQYHIKKCSAPCVDYIQAKTYNENIVHAQNFLRGQCDDIILGLSQRMQDASAALAFEKAGLLRDQIQSLRQLVSTQNIYLQDLHDTDIIAASQAGGTCCFHVVLFRNGYHCGHQPFFPKHDPEDTPENILSAFLLQFYERHLPPPQILLSHSVLDIPLIEEALSEKAGRSVSIQIPTRGPKKKIVQEAVMNAQQSLHLHFEGRQRLRDLHEELKALFDLPQTPQRIEIYDNSHLQGSYAYGAMVVAGLDGFLRADYRRFKIQHAQTNDDYGMMREVIRRRLTHDKLPDLLLIDGGLGQLNAVCQVLEEMGSTIPCVAIAKGPDRNAGREQFFLRDKPSFSLPLQSPVLFYLQRLRDEAHRYAITTHRKGRSQGMTVSQLDEIPGIGPKRKKALLLHFGSAYNISRAGLEDLQKVDGVEHHIARRIYDFFHSS